MKKGVLRAQRRMGENYESLNFGGANSKRKKGSVTKREVGRMTLAQRWSIDRGKKKAFSKKKGKRTTMRLGDKHETKERDSRSAGIGDLFCDSGWGKSGTKSPLQTSLHVIRRGNVRYLSRWWKKNITRLIGLNEHHKKRKKKSEKSVKRRSLSIKCAGGEEKLLGRTAAYYLGLSRKGLAQRKRYGIPKKPDGGGQDAAGGYKEPGRLGL